ncbi:MAG: light-harvesting protein [Pseudomonadota bacterium]
MNNSKMWLVVSPTVGVPIFLGAVAVGSFAVHVAVLSNTSWVDDFLQGVPMGTGDSAALEMDSNTAKASYVEDGVITVTLPDGTVTKAVLQSDAMASAVIPDAN